jgi:hypothetical protein
MKYFKEFLAEKYKIQPLGELTSEELFSSEQELIGESVIIDGYEIGLQVWYADYARWLEAKYDNLMETYLKLDPNTIN